MSADAMMEGEEKNLVIKKRDIFMSPHDVIIECKGEDIQTHSTVLRRCNYFTTLLDNAGLDNHADFREKIKIIPLPAAFDHKPSEVSEFVMVLYDTLDEADADNLRDTIRQKNVFSLAQLAHYFDAPVLNMACDMALANNREVWIPGKLIWLAEEAIKSHLLSLQETCTIELAADIDGAGLLAHFNYGRGVLCKNPAFLTELMSTMYTQHKTQNATNAAHIKQRAREHASVVRFQEEGPEALLRSLNCYNSCFSSHEKLATATRVIKDAFDKFFQS
jgi:hypothetical protein